MARCGWVWYGKVRLSEARLGRARSGSVLDLKVFLVRFGMAGQSWVSAGEVW